MIDSFGVGCFTGVFLIVLIEAILGYTNHECMVSITDTHGTHHVIYGVTK